MEDDTADVCSAVIFLSDLSSFLRISPVIYVFFRSPLFKTHLDGLVVASVWLALPRSFLFLQEGVENDSVDLSRLFQ